MVFSNKFYGVTDATICSKWIHTITFITCEKIHFYEKQLNYEYNDFTYLWLFGYYLIFTTSFCL